MGVTKEMTSRKKTPAVAHEGGLMATLDSCHRCGRRKGTCACFKAVGERRSCGFSSRWKRFFAAGRTHMSCICVIKQHIKKLLACRHLLVHTPALTTEAATS